MNSITEKKDGYHRVEVEKIVNYLNTHDMTLLSKSYKNANTKLDVLCNVCGNQWQAKWGHLGCGHGCPKCRNKQKGSYNKGTLGKIFLYLKDKTITLLSNKYESCDAKMLFECKTCGAIWSATAYRVTHGSGCPHCARSGENNPAWRGGWRKKDYILFTEKVKSAVRYRDDNKCQHPYCEKIIQKNKLDIHHIDGDKKNSNMENLISLCHSCHSKIEQNNPKEWMDYFYKKVIENEKRKAC